MSDQFLRGNHQSAIVGLRLCHSNHECVGQKSSRLSDYNTSFDQHQTSGKVKIVLHGHVKINKRREDVLLPVILLRAHYVLLLDLRGQDQPQHPKRPDVLLPGILGPHVLLRGPNELIPVIIGPGEVIPAT